MEVVRRSGRRGRCGIFARCRAGVGRRGPPELGPPKSITRWGGRVVGTSARILPKERAEFVEPVRKRVGEQFGRDEEGLAGHREELGRVGRGVGVERERRVPSVRGLAFRVDVAGDRTLQPVEFVAEGVVRDFQRLEPAPAACGRQRRDAVRFAVGQVELVDEFVDRDVGARCRVGRPAGPGRCLPTTAPPGRRPSLRPRARRRSRGPRRRRRPGFAGPGTAPGTRRSRRSRRSRRDRVPAPAGRPGTRSRCAPSA